MEPQTQPQEPMQQTLFDLEELSVKSTFSIDELRKQVKEARQVVKDHYSNSTAYNEQKNRVDGEKTQLMDIKKELDASPEIAPVVQKIKDLQLDIKEKELTVSDCALEYARMAGKDEIVKDGITFDIVKNAKLVKRKQ